MMINSDPNNNPLRKLKAATMTRLWVALTIVFASWLPAGATDLPAGKAQIQGGNLRIEFDHQLRSRVIARFDEKQTGMGPFTASETVTTANKTWTGFLLTSQKNERTKDAFGEGAHRNIVHLGIGGLHRVGWISEEQPAD
jgi:hypothetical protein